LRHQGQGKGRGDQHQKCCFQRRHLSIGCSFAASEASPQRSSSLSSPAPSTI
jgi:hypothetical protein